MKKKITALLLAAAVVASVFAGCGSGPEPDGEPVATGSTAAEKVLVLSEPGVYSQAGEYSDVVLKADGIVLENAVIHGSLTVDKAVGEGDATLRGCTVEGDVYLYGGGPNSVHFENCSLGTVLAEKKDLRLVLDSGTRADVVSARTRVRFEISAEVKTVMVESSAASSELLLTDEARVDRVMLNAAAQPGAKQPACRADREQKSGGQQTEPDR